MTWWDWVVTVVAFAVVLFLFGWQLYDRREWRHTCEREDMLRDLHHDFFQQEQKMLSCFRICSTGWIGSTASLQMSPASSPELSQKGAFRRPFNLLNLFARRAPKVRPEKG